MGTNILISGGSIAGPALAHWLHRFGFRTTIVELAPGLRPGGQAIDIRGIAKEVVRRMGLDRQVRDACTDTDGMSVVTRNNRRLATVRADLFDGDGVIAEIEILRGDLAEVFYADTKETTEYLFGDRIVALDDGTDGVVVRFASGLERSFDLVIGADGLHSGVRAGLRAGVGLRAPPRPLPVDLYRAQPPRAAPLGGRLRRAGALRRHPQYP